MPASASLDNLIGGPFSRTTIDPGLLPVEQQQLTEHQRAVLWTLFRQIGRCWGNVVSDSANLKSTWTEFIEVRTTTEPSYTGEYANAVSVLEDLIEMYGEQNAFTLLFLRSGVPEGPPMTRLAHAKRYVVDEFIRVQVTAGGFKSFGARNYKGYLGGSRYNRTPRVRAYRPAGGNPAGDPAGGTAGGTAPATEEGR